jgi:hypothetical protein
MASACLVILALLAAPLHAAELQPRLTGDTRIHDPSVIEVDGRYAAFGRASRASIAAPSRSRRRPTG